MVISDLDIQDRYNPYSNDPECAVDAFVEYIEHDQDSKYSKMSYQHMMV